jgi:hypothetical protein
MLFVAEINPQIRAKRQKKEQTLIESSALNSRPVPATIPHTLNLRCSGTLMKSDFRLVEQLALRASGRNTIWTLARVFLAVGVLSTSIGVIGCIIDQFGDYLGALGICFVIGVIGLQLWLSTSRATKAARAKALESLGHWSGFITDEEIEITTVHSRSRIAWNAVTAAGIAPDALVLLRGASFYIPFSSKFFGTPEDWEEFHAFVSSRFPQPPLKKQ